ncbi:hypothetical protein IMCC12053_1084 [Celeribacter marinus]|uniref:Uncharacterized protein n=1 Tax=Celeribacter marinus TaxID=1397108 RepID=A0A0P0A906_9RHOB|nr:hypothetical protein IMCC12053_1084 [Celeribacter marinus]
MGLTRIKVRMPKAMVFSPYALRASPDTAPHRRLNNRSKR